MPGITDPAEEYFKDGLWAWVTDQWKKLVATAGGALHVQWAGQEADVEVKQTAPADLCSALHAWEVDGDLWVPLYVATGTNSLQVSVSGDVDVVQQTPADMQVGSHGWDGSAWQKLALLFGYTERWHKDLEYTMPANGTYSQYTVAVPAGYIYVVQSASVMNNHGDRGVTKIGVYSGTDAMWLAANLTPVAGVPLIWNGGIVMSQGDRARLSMASCIQNDLISGAVRGYKMKIAE